MTSENITAFKLPNSQYELVDYVHRFHDYRPHFTDEQLIQKQAHYEAIFNCWPDTDYIRHMSFCLRCAGSGCPFCSLRGWLHTPQSMAFGLGLNSPMTTINPFDPVEENRKFLAFQNGKITRSRGHVVNIRKMFGIDSND